MTQWKLRTRRIWQGVTRILQVKRQPSLSYKIALGTPNVGTYVPETELRMLMRSFNAGAENDARDLVTYIVYCIFKPF